MLRAVLNSLLFSAILIWQFDAVSEPICNTTMGNVAAI